VVVNRNETPSPTQKAKPTPLTGTTESVVTGDKIKPGEATTPKKRVRASETETNTSKKREQTQPVAETQAPKENPNVPKRREAATGGTGSETTGSARVFNEREPIKSPTLEDHNEAGKKLHAELGDKGVLARVRDANSPEGKTLTDAEQVAASIYRNRLANDKVLGISDADAIAQIIEINKATAEHGAAFAQAGHSRQFGYDAEGNMVRIIPDATGSKREYLAAMQEAKGVNNPLTPSEIADYTALQKEVADLQKKVTDYELSTADLKAKLAAERAKKQIEGYRQENAVRKQARKDTKEAIAARKKDALNKAFRALQGQASALGFDRLAAAAPHFKDAAKELVKEGVVGLSDVVDALVTEAKVQGVKVSKREVLGILAGEYDLKPNTRKDKVETIRQQARREIRRQVQESQNKIRDAERREAQLAKDAERTAKANEREAKKRAAADERFRASEERKRLRKLEKLDKANDRELRAAHKASIGGQLESLLKRLNEAESALMSPPKLKTRKPPLPPELLDATIKLNAAKFKARQAQERVQAKADYDLLSQSEKNRESLNQLLGVSRTALTSIDRSAMGRQALFLAVSHPSIIRNVIRAQNHAAKLEGNYAQVMGEVMSNPYFDKALNAKLDLGGLTGRRGGEFFRSDFLSKPLEVAGRDANLFARSERAYDAALVTARMEAFALEVNGLEKAKGSSLDMDQLKLVAEHINQVSGSGTGPKAMHLKGFAGSNLFAPGYLVSKFQTATGAALRKSIMHGVKTGDWSIAKVQAMNYGKFLASVGAAAYLLTDDRDPKSSRFLTKRFGNQRLNLAGGFQQPIIMFCQLAFGTTDANGKHRPPNWRATLGNFATGKEGVGLRFAQSISEKESYGKNTDITTLEGAGNVAKSMAIPISLQNAQDIWNDPTLNQIQKALLITAAYYGFDVNQQPQPKDTGRSQSRGARRRRDPRTR
jgi:hypothetical protein